MPFDSNMVCIHPLLWEGCEQMRVDLLTLTFGDQMQGTRRSGDRRGASPQHHSHCPLRTPHPSTSPPTPFTPLHHLDSRKAAARPTSQFITIPFHPSSLSLSNHPSPPALPNTTSLSISSLFPIPSSTIATLPLQPQSPPVSSLSSLCSHISPPTCQPPASICVSSSDGMLRRKALPACCGLGLAS